MKNPVTPVGIEPSTFRFVAQRLNHCATAVPPYHKYRFFFLEVWNGQGVALITHAHLLPTFTLSWAHPLLFQWTLRGEFYLDVRRHVVIYRGQWRNKNSQSNNLTTPLIATVLAMSLDCHLTRGGEKNLMIAMCVFPVLLVQYTIMER